MNDKQTGTIRSTMPSVWATLAVWLVARLGLDLSADDWQVLFVIGPIIGGVVYRLGREVEAKWPAFGRVLFGSARQPHYDAEG